MDEKQQRVAIRRALEKEVERAEEKMNEADDALSAATGKYVKILNDLSDKKDQMKGMEYYSEEDDYVEIDPARRARDLLKREVDEQEVRNTDDLRNARNWVAFSASYFRNDILASGWPTGTYEEVLDNGPAVLTKLLKKEDDVKIGNGKTNDGDNKTNDGDNKTGDGNDKKDQSESEDKQESKGTSYCGFVVVIVLLGIVCAGLIGALVFLSLTTKRVEEEWSETESEEAITQDEV